MDRLFFIYLSALLLFLTMQADTPEKCSPATVPSTVIQVVSALESGSFSDHSLAASTPSPSDNITTKKLLAESRHGNMRTIRLQKNQMELHAENQTGQSISTNLQAYRQAWDRCRALRHASGTYLYMLHTMII